MNNVGQHENPRRRASGARAGVCAWAAAFALTLCATWGASAYAVNPLEPMAPRYAQTTTDGKTRVVAAPSTTTQGVAAVMHWLMGPSDEVKRLDALLKGELVALPRGGEPVSAALAWDGQAWKPWVEIPADAKIPAWKPANMVAGEKARGEDLLDRLQANAPDAKSESGKPLVDLLKAEVAGLADLARLEEFAQPIGEVKPVEKPLEGAGVSGIAKPLTASRTVPHRVQLWLAPAGAGMPGMEGREFNYSLQMAHARAGRTGAFYYVAYADTNGDGLPDRLIARSPLAMSTKDGGWTGWSFSSSEHMVFVGNAWLDGATEVFFAEAGPGQEAAWTGISRDVNVSALFCGLPNLRLSKKAFLTNVRYQVQP